MRIGTGYCLGKCEILQTISTFDKPANCFYAYLLQSIACKNCNDIKNIHNIPTKYMEMKFLPGEVIVLSIWTVHAVLICGQNGSIKFRQNVQHEARFLPNVQHIKWEYYQCQLSASDTSKCWNSNLFLCVWVELILNQDFLYSAPFAIWFQWWNSLVALGTHKKTSTVLNQWNVCRVEKDQTLLETRMWITFIGGWLHKQQRLLKNKMQAVFCSFEMLKCTNIFD